MGYILIAVLAFPVTMAIVNWYEKDQKKGNK